MSVFARILGMILGGIIDRDVQRLAVVALGLFFALAVVCGYGFRCAPCEPCTVIVAELE